MTLRNLIAVVTYLLAGPECHYPATVQQARLTYYRSRLTVSERPE